jgi:signal transduction histidine kinase
VVALLASVASAVASFLKDPLLALALVVYIVALTSSARAARIALVAVEGAIAIAAAVSWWVTAGLAMRSDAGSFVIGAGAVQLAAWTVGVAARKQREYTRGIAEQAQRRVQAQVALAQAQLARVQQAVAEERLRIAQELHDVVAHSMSVIAVQAGVGHHVIASQPQEAAKSLAAIETTSRATLQEMRRLLGLLRDGAPGDASGCGPEDLLPTPSLADLPALIAQTRGAGLRAELRIVGARRTLHPGLELAAYRIVQEALTNVVKHAGTPSGQVVITYSPDDLRIEVTDDGAPVPPAARSAVVPTGHGLIGMRERVACYGGRLDAGPLPGRGFRVDAWLPVGEAA